jgi:hypothetical protein
MYTFLILFIFLIFIYFFSNDNLSNRDIENIKILSRQAARWSVAAEQDKNPLISVLHANYGAGFLWALSDLYYPEEIKTATNIDYNKFKKHITNIQDTSVRKLGSICPNYMPSTSYLAKIAGEK